MFIYLDLNHFINLAKAEKNGDLSQIKRLIQLVKIKKVFLPISAAHFVEIVAIRKGHQREDISHIIKLLNPEKLVLRHIGDVRYFETLERVAQFYNRPLPFNSIKDVIFGRGFLRAFGDFEIDFSSWKEEAPEKIKAAEKLLRNTLGSEQVLDVILEDHIKKKNETSPEFDGLQIKLEQNRLADAGKTLSQMEGECVLGLAQDFIKYVMTAVRTLGLSSAEILANPPKEFWTKEYMATLPSYFCWSLLHLYLHHYGSRPLKANHIYDMGHLAVALPYCDIVVCDKELHYEIVSHKMDKRFSVKVFSKLSEAIDHAEQHVS